MEIAGEVEAVELGADVGCGGKPGWAIGDAELVDSIHQFASDTQRFSVLVSDLKGEDVPDGDEQLASNGDNSLVATQARFETGKLGFPVGVRVGGGLGSFDHSSAEFSASSFGDLAGASGEAGVMNSPAQASITDQVLGVWEAGDLADGGQDREGVNDAKAGQLYEQGQARLLGGELVEAGFEVGDLLASEGQGLQVGEDAHLFNGGKGQAEPPGTLLGQEWIAVAGQDVVAVEHSV